MLSQVAMEQERMLPVLQDLLRTNNDLELRSLTGFLRNLSRHARDKNDFCKYPTHSLPRLSSMICFKPQVAIISLVPNCTLTVVNTCVNKKRVTKTLTEKVSVE